MIVPTFLALYAIVVIGLTRRIARHDLYSRGTHPSRKMWLAFALTAASVPVLAAPWLAWAILRTAWSGLS